MEETICMFCQVGPSGRRSVMQDLYVGPALTAQSPCSALHGRTVACGKAAEN